MAIASFCWRCANGKTEPPREPAGHAEVPRFAGVKHSPTIAFASRVTLRTVAHSMKPLRKLAFVVNEDKAGAPALARELSAIARQSGVKFKSTTRFPLPRGYLKGVDACCVIGGDGTLLGVARQSTEHQVPIIGVNRGSLGFLTTFSSDEARAHFADLLNGSFRIDYRAMLSCSTGPGVRDLALNDVLIKDEVNSRLVRLEVFADGELVTDYTCDGLIFSTATGSTAYNLSAGGPILHPSANVIAMTPICPHTLSNRSIIFRDTVKIRVFNRSDDSRLLVAMDGQRNMKVSANAVEISVANTRLPLVQRADYSHFAVVRTKLSWSGAFAEKS
jgi:NAD+ kinase